MLLLPHGVPPMRFLSQDIEVSDHQEVPLGGAQHIQPFAICFSVFFVSVSGGGGGGEGRGAYYGGTPEWVSRVSARTEFAGHAVRSSETTRRSVLVCVCVWVGGWVWVCEWGGGGWKVCVWVWVDVGVGVEVCAGV